jgi:hypothetical protein
MRAMVLHGGGCSRGKGGGGGDDLMGLMWQDRLMDCETRKAKPQHKQTGILEGLKWSPW